jgi:hypothetical protein
VCRGWSVTLKPSSWFARCAVWLFDTLSEEVGVVILDFVWKILRLSKTYNNSDSGLLRKSDGC